MAKELTIILPIKNTAYFNDKGGTDNIKVYDYCVKQGVFDTALGPGHFSGCSINEDNEYGGRDGATRGVRVLLHDKVSLDSSGTKELLRRVRLVAAELGNKTSDVYVNSSDSTLFISAYAPA